MKKNKLINLILYFNEYDLLQKRIEYYKDHVDEFIIFDLKIHNLSYHDSIKNEELVKLIKSVEGIGFEDIIWCSKVNDIIHPEELHKLKTNSDFQVLNHKILNWSDNLSLGRETIGSFSITYSSILRNNTLLNEIHTNIQYKDNIRNNDTVGYQLIGFQNMEGFSDNLEFLYGQKYNTSELTFFRNNLLSIDEYNKTQVLEDIGCQLGGFFNLPFEHRPPKDIEIEILPDGLMIENTFYMLDLPSNYRLGSQSDFIKNESLRLVKQHFPLMEDNILLKNKTENKVSVLKYSDFINCIPSKLT